MQNDINMNGVCGFLDRKLIYESCPSRFAKA
jgi:hypothetical protein